MLETLPAVQAMMVAKLKKDGIAAEVTFISSAMFSILVDDKKQFERVKAIFSRVPTVQFDSEDHSDELGHVVYYRY